MMTMKVALMAAVFALNAFSCSGNKPSTPNSTAAPNFVLKTSNGTPVELKGLSGKVVVVNFWATWCGPCRAEIPGMQKVYDKYRDKGLEIVGIALDQGGWGDVNPFVTKMNMTYPVVLGDDEVAKAYGGIDAIPTTVVVDRNGNIASRHVGLLSEGEFEASVKSLL